MGVFQAGRRRLVEQGDDAESRGHVGVQREEALGARGVGRHADRGFDRFAGGQVGVGVTLQVGFELRQEPGEQIGQAVVTPGQVDLGLRAGVVEQTLERAQHRPPRIVPDGRGVGAEAQLAGGIGGDDRRPRVDAVEGDDGIVASIDGRDDGVGGAKVDADSHRASLGPRLGLGHNLFVRRVRSPVRKASPSTARARRRWCRPRRGPLSSRYRTTRANRSASPPG